MSDWRALWDESPVGFAVFDRSLNFLYINRTLARLNGRTVEAHTGKGLQEILPPTSVEMIEPLMRKVLERGEAIERVDFIGQVVEGGAYGALLAYYCPVRNASGEVWAVSATIVEASDLFRDRIFIDSRDTRTRLLLEATHAITFTTSPSGELETFGGTWAEYTGQTVDEARGWGWLERIHPDDRERVRERWLETMASEEPLMLEARLWWQRCEDYRHSEIRLVPVRTKAGTIHEWAGLALDVHARATAVEVREKLLQTERRARQESERANLLKDEFVATISHELRTPLTTVMGWADLLNRPGLDPDSMASGLREIRSAVARQAQMIGDLLDISRMSMGKLALNKEEMSLRDALLGSLEAMRPKALERRLRLTSSIAEDPVRVYADPVRLRQILENILGNAIKFTPPGGMVCATLDVSIPGFARVTVTDTGEGIAPDVLPHVFDRFRQGDSSATRRHGGLGLGLAIVRELASAHGGRVWAESDGIGQGTRVAVELPTLAPPVNDTASPLAEPGAGLHGRRVLLIECEVATAALFRRGLMAEGAEVAAATSVEVARSHLKDDPFDCVIVGLGADSCGLELFSELVGEGLVDPATTAAIAVASPDNRLSRSCASQAGFRGVLTKPMRAEELAAAVASAVASPPPDPTDARSND